MKQKVLMVESCKFPPFGVEYVFNDNQDLIAIKGADDYIMRAEYDDVGNINKYSDNQGNWYDKDKCNYSCPYNYFGKVTMRFNGNPFGELEGTDGRIIVNPLGEFELVKDCTLTFYLDDVHSEIKFMNQSDYHVILLDGSKVLYIFEDISLLSMLDRDSSRVVLEMSFYRVIKV